MNKLHASDPVVLTLDAGGTNFVFSAMQSGSEIVESFSVPAITDTFDGCISTLEQGFRSVMDSCPQSPAAISFAFPGPADYQKGLIGPLPNLPAFNKPGIPLGPALEDIFKIPVFINNDGNLFALGESYAGFLPWVNQMLKQGGSKRTYNNLIGVTLGTGFGGGIVVNGKVIVGDNSNAGEVWTLRNRLYPNSNAEENIGVSAITRKYHEYSQTQDSVEPKDIYEIAVGDKKGDREAALKTFGELAIVLGDSLATVVNLIDGLIVIGGGIAAAYPLFIDAVLDEMNSSYTHSTGREFPRLVSKALNLEKPDQLQEFISRGNTQILKNGSTRIIGPEPVIGIGTSRLGTSKAIAVGAYAMAVNRLS